MQLGVKALAQGPDGDVTLPTRGFEPATVSPQHPNVLRHIMWDVVVEPGVGPDSQPKGSSKGYGGGKPDPETNWGG